jgi:hypothetical protein
VGPKASLNIMEKRNITCPCRESNHGRPARSPSLHRLSIPAPALRISKIIFLVFSFMYLPDQEMFETKANYLTYKYFNYFYEMSQN